MRWEKIQLLQSGINGDEFPGKRWGHTCNSIKGGRFLYVFGGYGRSNRQTNSVHVFDTAEQTWSKLVVRGAPPTPRDSHTCTTVGENLFVFGGTDRRGPLNDLHIFDTCTHTWINPSLRGEGPAAREGHSAAVVGKRLFVFGGCGRSTTGAEINLNDVYILNTETFVWKRAATVGTPPCKRDSHSCSTWKNQVIVIAGEDSRERYLSDVHILDADTLAWKELNTSGRMLPTRASHTTVSFGKNLFVFGGFTDDQNVYNDLYMLDVETAFWTKLTTTGDMPSPRFSVAGDCIHPLKPGVLAFISGCSGNLEALDDMYYLHTGFAQDDRRPEKLSLRKQLKLKCQEQNLTVPVLDKALVSVDPSFAIRQPMSVSCFSQPGRENIPVNQAQTFEGKKTFQAKVTKSIPCGFTIKTIIDGKPLRGILFAKTSISLPMANNNNNSSRKRTSSGSGGVTMNGNRKNKSKSSRVEDSTGRAQSDGVYGQTEVTLTPDFQNLALPEPQTDPTNATLTLTMAPVIFNDGMLNDGPSSSVRASEETPTSKDTDTLSPNQDERKQNGEHGDSANRSL